MVRGLWSQPRLPWLPWPHNLRDPDGYAIDSNSSFGSYKLSIDYSEQVSMGLLYDSDIDSVDSKTKISCGQPISRLCAGVLRKSSLEMPISIMRKNVSLIVQCYQPIDDQYHKSTCHVSRWYS